KDAKLIYEGEHADVSSSGFIIRDGSESHLMVWRGITFYTRQIFIWQNNKMQKLDIPEDSEFSSLLNNQLILELKSDWSVNGKTYKQGSLISLNFSALIKGEKEIQLIFQPDEFTSVSQVSSTKN